MDFDSIPMGGVKQEFESAAEGKRRSFGGVSAGIPLVDLSSDSEDDEAQGNANANGNCGNNNTSARKRALSPTPTEGDGHKRSRGDSEIVVLPAGFLDPLPPVAFSPSPQDISKKTNEQQGPRIARQNAPNKFKPNLPGKGQSEPRSQSRVQSPFSRKSTCKQFWKAGDYEGNSPATKTKTVSGGLDHVRVHPKFLHSNATSHKWALGAFAELLDNSLDEACNGATLVNIDMLLNQKDGSPMLMIEDNGGGMDPDKMRSCMSLGYSAKSKLANMIGQYGNGFKTSTMRLGADVIVFSRCRGGKGKSSTQSIGLLSYTFLQSTGQEDIVVPMVDYEIQRDGPKELIRSIADDWHRNFETIEHWSPFSSEAELLQQFDGMRQQGTRIILYNLWENDQGELELDFDTDAHDIQVRGANSDKLMIKMAESFPNSRHYLTYKHSLRSYASILYLRLPPGFKIILRGKDVEHHSLVGDLMLTQEITYKPQGVTDISHKENNIVVVTVGFVKDAKDHIDVQGFNVYHKNRLIKPFWRIWNPAGSDGRGVIGVLEANFIEPAHDKQGFERTTVLARLESKLIQMQKDYWRKNCHLIGYAQRHGKKNEDSVSAAKESVAALMNILSSASAKKVDKKLVSATKEIGVSEIGVACSTTVKKAEKISVSPFKEIGGTEAPLSSSTSGKKAQNNSVSVTKDTGATEIPLTSSVKGVQSVQVNSDSVPSVTHVQSMVHENRQLGPSVVEEVSFSRQELPIVMNKFHKEPQLARCAGSPLQRLSKSSQITQESLQKHLDSPELRIRGNQQTLQIHSIPSESPEQVQIPSHTNSALYSLTREPSDGAASSVPALAFRPPKELDTSQSNGRCDSAATTTTQISRVATSIAVDGIGSSSTVPDGLAHPEFGSSSRLKSQVVNTEVGSTSLHDDIIDCENIHVSSADRGMKLEVGINQLKERLKVEVETNRKLQAHNAILKEKLELSQRYLEEAIKNRETLNAILSAERLQRDLEENELRNKLKNAELRLRELEQRQNGFN